ncbi:30S ribosomal protein S1 [Candidatus Kaiserbacteria bacterium CG10_big_fil_rev_8_21_14_0_10_45_20]|uniref:30S ribosomal protein S1 n=1 Tax=Candidatus Kaiserbacteria bacterium CG10_big_fil_rev_8_21_14_0_10_45_20 TaxID=1974607 RepID=A0A2H0UFV3_9BACT|nr:MAG: 30S ribosomal protein S1 [Candidatus Kaiserbacteria bacterium CG10_big_fil_rev_8_21_14_0_10_45_20]
METKIKEEGVMHSFVEETPEPPALGDTIEGPVVAIGSGRVYVDLPPFGTGIIYGREYLAARDILKKVALGDTIAAKIVDTENEEGYIELSLKEARQAMMWSDAEKAIAEGTVFTLPIKDANKGGLIIAWQGINGFLPASQLRTEHYPRVANGEKQLILDELKKLIGEMLPVRIITADPREGKLIFSEKELSGESKESTTENYEVGDVLEGEVTGIVDFGVFVKVDSGIEGLVHISEIDWGLVEDPHSFAKVGDRVKVKVIDVKDGKISLSFKQLQDDPWVSASDRFKKDTIVEAAIIKYNKYGALASIEEGVAGLVHVSEFESEAELKEKLSLGKTYKFAITLFDPKEHRMTLSYTKANS